MQIIQAIILGIVQGLTEFIPISSSSHLIVIPWLFDWNDPALASLPFDISLHLGTLVALLWFFAGDWVRLVRAGIASIVERKIGNDQDRRMAWMLVLGSIPGAIVGALAESKVEEWFHPENTPIHASSMIIMGVFIALLGAALFIAERVARHLRKLDQVTFKDAILIGLAQSLAIFPGVSRSGSTITAGLALGLEREAAARFSFLLSAPLILGAGAKSSLTIINDLRAGTIPMSDAILFPIGFLAATLSGYLCIKYLLRFMQSHSTDVFVYYRWALAVLVIIVALVRG